YCTGRSNPGYPECGTPTERPVEQVPELVPGHGNTEWQQPSADRVRKPAVAVLARSFCPLHGLIGPTLQMVSILLACLASQGAFTALPDIHAIIRYLGW